MTASKKLQSTLANAGGGGGGWTLDNVTDPNLPRFITEAINPTTLFFKPDGTKVYTIEEGTTRGAHEYSLSTAWDLTTASHVNFFDTSVAESEGDPIAISFKSDGTKMYVVGGGNDYVYEYTLSTAWDISTASYVDYLDVGTYDSIPAGLCFKPDGTIMYIVGDVNNQIIQYSLSTAWDVSTGTQSQLITISNYANQPRGLFIKDDGTKIYVVDRELDNIVEFSFSTAWDITTITHNYTYNATPFDVALTGLFFKPDGTEMYIAGEFNEQVNAFKLSTAWDISTAYYDVSEDKYFYVGDEEITPEDLFFKPDGTKLYIIGSNGNEVNEYSLSTAWKMSTATHVQAFSVSSQESQANAVFFSDDGTNMYITGQTDAVYQYTLSTVWDVSTASYDQSFSVKAEEASPKGLFFSSDGTKMFVTGTDSEGTWKYTLSTAWDISTASIPSYGRFLVGSYESNPCAVFFKPDGTKMFICGSSGDEVNEFSLSTAWDVSTASYAQVFSVSAQEPNPQGLFFKPDGTKMYICGSSGDEVNEYSLSSAWDISTASFQTNFNVNSYEASPRGVFFKPDGTKMYIVGTTSDSVHEYNLSSSWSISSASYVQSFDVLGQTSGARDISFNDDGTIMYIIDDIIYKYTLSTAWDISTASYTLNNSLEGSISTEGFYFKPDGTKVFIANNTIDAIESYSLSTAWDITTATFDAPAGSYAYMPSNYGLFFDSDGTKIFGVDLNSIVNEYELSTAWDLSTSSYIQNHDVELGAPNTRGISFKSDGTEMYVVGSNQDTIVKYDL